MGECSFSCTDDAAAFVFSLLCGDALNVSIKENVKQYEVMSYTTDLDTVRKIIHNKTIRSTSISNEKLNDQTEKQRNGVMEYADARFITCFSHTDKESKYMWEHYGGTHPENKVRLHFRNFAKDFKKYIRTDFAIVEGNKLCFFKSPEYDVVIARSSSDDEEKYDLRSCIQSIRIFDVEYENQESPVFTKDYSGVASITFEQEIGQSTDDIKLPCYNPTVLGKHKHLQWGPENETRILIELSDPTFKGWDHIDLQLYDEAFRNLQIILSPWDDGTLRNKVKKIIKSSGLSPEIADSIVIVDSSLGEKINP